MFLFFRMFDLIDIENFVSSLYKDKLSSHFYHNLSHTQTVVHTIIEICDYEKIDEQSKHLLIVAGWFHDIGYLYSKDNHEQESVNVFKQYCQSKAISFDTNVERLIMTTNMSFIPEQFDEKIIKDADFFHLGNKDYFKYAKSLRKEWKAVCSKELDNLSFLELNLDFLESKHQYYTSFGKNVLQPIKEENIEKLKQKINYLTMADQQKSKKKKDKKDKDKSKYERGVETLFKTTLTNHTRLSEIADSKANILLSVNTIIISIVLSVLIPKLDNINNAYLLLPTVVLVSFSVLSVVFAILSTRPKIDSSKISTEDLDQDKVNLLFFGNFSKINLNDYQKYIQTIINDPDKIYNSLIRDLYFLGLVLDRKYKMLRVTYNIFMFGIIVSVLVFIAAVYK